MPAELEHHEMNEQQLNTKQRVSALLFNRETKVSDEFRDIETLLNSSASQNFCSELLQFFVHTAFEEQEAQLHWARIFDNYDYLAEGLNRDVGLRVAIFDYFVNLNRVVSSPIMVEMHVFKETEKLAMVDSLTGIFNRRYFDVGLKKEIKRSQRYGSALSLLMIDIDNFKEVNDTKGHLFGDDVLKRLAIILGSISREEDIPCRYGGEEFVVILPETNTEGALTFAARLRAEMRNDAFLREHRITCSGGITSYPEGGESSVELLKSADKAMYQAKFSGKDRCMVSANSQP